MTPSLPQSFLTRAIAHRALHDIADGRPENSLAAIQAAAEVGYGIEIDLQLSSDGVAMVFHDYQLERLTDEVGAVRSRSAEDLSRIRLKGGDEGIPSLAEVLSAVGGRVPLLIELKDQDGELGPNVGALERATAEALDGYEGDVALMSFNPHAVAELARLAPTRPRGLTTERFRPGGGWPVSDERLRELSEIPDFDRVGASFISHDARDLTSPKVARIKARGVPVLCWTIRSPEAEREARKIADNVTFEGYLPG